MGGYHFLNENEYNEFIFCKRMGFSGVGLENSLVHSKVYLVFGNLSD